MTDRDRRPPTLGDIIRQQRELAALPMRQLAAMVGISNPYLSQIERGLRAPSDHVLESIATSLRTTADALYERAEEVVRDDPPLSSVLVAIGEDPDLTARQRQALTEMYVALTESTRARRRRGGRSTHGTDGETDADTLEVLQGGDPEAADDDAPGAVGGGATGAGGNGGG